ncbi:hypothetical protein IAT38_007010 [Cryptococcus sp. DSM 104549]
MSQPFPARPALKALTTVSDINIPILPLTKLARSFSVFSATSTTSTDSAGTAYSRSADDMIDRLANHHGGSTIDLWSGGNIRLNGRDLTMTTQHAEDLLNAMKDDARFKFVKLTFFDAEGDDWKISITRSHSFSSAISSDSE